MKKNKKNIKEKEAANSGKARHILGTAPISEKSIEAHMKPGISYDAAKCQMSK